MPDTLPDFQFGYYKPIAKRRGRSNKAIEEHARQRHCNLMIQDAATVIGSEAAEWEVEVSRNFWLRRYKAPGLIHRWLQRLLLGWKWSYREEVKDE